MLVLCFGLGVSFPPSEAQSGNPGVATASMLDDGVCVVLKRQVWIPLACCAGVGDDK